MSQDLRNSIGTKERSIGDLLEFVGTRTDSVPNYTLLLGAGASVTSGVRPASELVDQWRKELYERCCSTAESNHDAGVARDYLARHESQWYSPQREYSSLFEKKFDLPRQRRMFVENEVAGKMPSIGYAYLVKLIQRGFFSTVFTTNFDDLLNEAFHQFSDLRPVICAHDSSIGSVTVTSKRPKIVKLHGDYLFDDIKSTQRETESLEENTKRKFMEFAKDHGLVVVGYSGHDRSVMDVLQKLLKHEDYFRHGVYWCVRDSNVPSEELTKLLWRERAYWVRVDGFDEIMGEIYRRCVGRDLPVDTMVVSEKPREVIRRFCENKFLKNSPSKTIQEDTKRLFQEMEREDFIVSMRDFVKEDDEECGSEYLTDRELIQLMGIQKDLSAQNVDVAIERIQGGLANAKSSQFKEHLLRLRFSVEKSQGRDDACRATCDLLIELDANNVGHRLQKARLERSLEAALLDISKAIEIDPYHASPLVARAGLREERLGDDPECDFELVCSEIESDYKKALELDPGISNPAWGEYFDFVRQNPFGSKSERAQKLVAVVSAIEQMDALSEKYFELTMRYAVFVDAPESDKRAIVDEIRKAIAIQPRSRMRRMRMLLLRVLKAFAFMLELTSELSSYGSDEGSHLDAQFVEFQARVHAENEGKLFDAIHTLECFKRHKKERRIVKLLVEYLCYADRATEASSLIEECRKIFEEADVLEMDCCIATTMNDSQRVLTNLAKLKRKKLFPAGQVVAETHELLKLGRAPEAEQMAREVLVAVHFSRFYELIINFEIACTRQGRKADKTRLLRVLEGSESAITRTCAALLMDEKDKAEELLYDAIRQDRTTVYRVRRWAIFENTQLSAWLSTKLRSKGLEPEVEGGVIRKAV